MITRSSSSSLISTPIKSKTDSTTLRRNLDDSSFAAPTPEKPLPTPPFTRRARLRDVALSVKEVRHIASEGRTDNNNNNKSKLARKQILSWPNTKEEDEERIVDDSRKPRKANTSPNLPEKYAILGEFFDSLDNTIRLLKLKSTMATFTKVSPNIQSLTDRRFTHNHLAQLKFILPEAIEIKKILVFDERTSCMKPELHIAMNVDAIECEGKSKPGSKNLPNLRKVFRKRLLEFHKAHPQGDEVSEEPLPEPFNMSQKGLHSHINISPQKLPRVKPSSETFANQTPAVASLLPQSFRRRFSQTVKSDEVEKTNQIPPKPSVIPSPEPGLHEISFNNEAASSSPLPSRHPATPIKKMEMNKNTNLTPSNNIFSHSTPAKLALTPARLMTDTPDSRPPKRSYKSPIEDSTNTLKKLVRRPPRTRSLQFDTPVKKEVIKSEVEEMEEGLSVDDSNDDGDDDDDILPEGLLELIREKERKALEERDPAISQAKRRQQMINCLPKLFNMIHFLFQSLKRSVITKDELMYKIVASHLGMVDKREVEEQLTLLLELVPDWISEKLALSGDLLISVNKSSSAESIRSRLAEAK